MWNPVFILPVGTGFGGAGGAGSGSSGSKRKMFRILIFLETFENTGNFHQVLDFVLYIVQSVLYVCENSLKYLEAQVNGV